MRAVADSLKERLARSPIGNRLIRGTFWTLIGTILSRGLGLMSSLIIARILSRAELGELGIIQSTVGLFGTFAGLGMGMTATKFVAERRRVDPIGAGEILSLSRSIAWITGGVMALILIAAAPLLAREALAAPKLTSYLRIAAPMLFFGSVNGAQLGALSGFEAFKAVARINLVCGLASFPLILLGTWLLGLRGAVIAIVLGQVLNCILNSLALHHECKTNSVAIRWGIERKHWRLLRDFSVPAFICALLFGPADWICNALLVRHPGGYVEMGYYTAANQWFGAVVFLPAMLSQALLPVLSERLGQNDRKRSARILTLSIRLNATIIAPLVVAGCVASPYIMRSYGSSFGSAWPTLIAVLCTAGLFSILSPAGQYLIAAGRLWVGMVMNLMWAITYITLAHLLVDHGSTGIAIARLGAYGLHTVWTLAFVFHLAKQVGRSEHVQVQADAIVS